MGWRVAEVESALVDFGVDAIVHRVRNWYGGRSCTRPFKLSFNLGAQRNQGYKKPRRAQNALSVAGDGQALQS